MFQGFLRVYYVAVLLSVSACSLGQPVKGYAGEDRPRAELSLVTLPRAVYELEQYARQSSAHRTIDGKTVPHSGILLLPGNHELAVNYLHGVREESCVPVLSADWLQHHWRWQSGTYRYWNPYFYSHYIDSACRILVYEVTCSGSFPTIAGSDYALELKVGEGADSAPAEIFLVEQRSAEVKEKVGTCAAGAPTRIWAQRRF